MKIYNLLHDSENYRWLEYQGDWFDFFHDINCSNTRIDNFDYVIRCKAIRDKKERVLGDYPCFVVPAISQKAKEVLESQLSDFIQIFPLETGKLGQYYFINILNVLDCLDKNKSEIQYLPSSDMIYKIRKWKFNSRLNDKNSKIFIIKNQMGERIYIDENIKKIIDENNLKGFVFREVGEINENMQ